MPDQIEPVLIVIAQRGPAQNRGTGVICSREKNDRQQCRACPNIRVLFSTAVAAVSGPSTATCEGLRA